MTAQRPKLFTSYQRSAAGRCPLRQRPSPASNTWRGVGLVKEQTADGQVLPQPLLLTRTSCAPQRRFSSRVTVRLLPETSPPPSPSSLLPGARRLRCTLVVEAPAPALAGSSLATGWGRTFLATAEARAGGRSHGVVTLERRPGGGGERACKQPRNRHRPRGQRGGG